MNACEVLNGLRPGAAPSVGAEAARELRRILEATALRRIPSKLHEWYVDDVVNDIALYVVNRQQSAEPFKAEAPARCRALLNTLVWTRYLAIRRYDGRWPVEKPREPDEKDLEPPFPPEPDPFPARSVSWAEFRKLVIEPYLESPTPFPVSRKNRGGNALEAQSPKGAQRSWDELLRVLGGEPKKDVADGKQKEEVGGGKPKKEVVRAVRSGASTTNKRDKALTAYDARQSRFRSGLSAKVVELRAAGKLDAEEAADCERYIELMRDRSAAE